MNKIDHRSLDIEGLLADNKHLEQLRLSDLVLDNSKFHQIKLHLLVIKGLESIIIQDTFAKEDVRKFVSLITNNPTLCELLLLDCVYSKISKIHSRKL